MSKTTYFIDHLTMVAWFRSIWPALFKSRLARKEVFRKCYFVDGSWFATGLARSTAALLGMKLEKLEFKLTGVTEENGTQSHLLVTYRGLNNARKEVTEGPFFKQLKNDRQLPGRLADFLGKAAVNGEPGDRGTVGHAQYMAHVCAWKNRIDGDPSQSLVLFQEAFPWFETAQNYATSKGVTLVPVRPRFAVKNALRKRVPAWLMWRLQGVKHGRNLARESQRIEPGGGGDSAITSLDNQASVSPSSQGPRLLVESIGMLNINRPDLHSDLFFWQKSPLLGSDILLTFAIPQVPLDQRQLQELQEHRMSALVLHPGASIVPTAYAPNFRPLYRSRPTRSRPPQIKGYRAEKRWLKEQEYTYRAMRDYWSKLCSENNIRVMATQDKYDATHYAIADALEANGGIMALYQRAFESDPSPTTSVSADIVFGFSNSNADVERKSGSKAQYHITTGYLGDHRFPLVRDSAQVIREGLLSHGARHIMAFFDENSREDARWHFCHRDMQVNFDFLIQKVLDDPWFGLVIKPKLSRTLKNRLGPVANLLTLAEATGRCYVFDDDSFRGIHPPVAAALAADIAVHSHLSAATAGVESALAGVPTLLLDAEGWSGSPFYRLGTGKTVFTSWNDLWRACLEQWSNPDRDPALGDWSIMLDELDPFRDGRASERMGTYLHWLLQSFKDGADRDVAMADAAQRYAELWGQDKVTDINWDAIAPQPEPAVSGLEDPLFQSVSSDNYDRSRTTP